MVNLLRQWPVILLALLLSPVASFGGQVVSRTDGLSGQRPTPMPEGQRITASDGDTIVIEGDARVRIVRRWPAFVRLVADTERRFVVLIVEHLSALGAAPTYRSDKSYTFGEITAEWPMATRWEGPALVDEHVDAAQGPHVRVLSLETSHGTILFGNRESLDEGAFKAATATVSYMILGVGGGGKQPFDQEESRQVAMAMQNAARRAQGAAPIAGGPGYTSAWMSMSSGPVDSRPPSASPTPDGAVRVGSKIAPLRKIHHVDPVMPEQARAARMSGIVVLEITVGADGVVTNARVLRSIPLLDEAALDAVRQWRYEPLPANGQTKPVIMTTTVSFGPG